MDPSIIAGKYRVARAIGKGGMGAVYEAVHEGTGKHVALKVMSLRPGHTDDDNHAAVARFEREARVAGSIETQHIAHVYDTGIDEPTGMPYMVMELLKGEDLQKVLRKLGRLRPDLALRVVAQACVGLSRAHAAGVVHRDIKPSNLFLARGEFGDLILKIVDFGIAKGLDSTLDKENHTLTRTGTLVGSPQYMSPEQAKGDKTLDHRTDVWSLGVVLFKCLTGLTPFDHLDTIGEVIVAVCSEDAPKVQDAAPWVSPELGAVVKRSLRRRREERYQSADEMLDALKPLLPDGFRITSDMLVAPTEAETAQIAQRRSEKPFALASPVSDSRAPDAIDVTFGTIAAVSDTKPKIANDPRSSSAKRSWTRASVAAAVGGGALLIAGAAGGLSAVRGALARWGSAEDQAPAVAPKPPMDRTPSPAPASLDRTAKLAVSSGVVVEIDGAPALVVDGSVVISGALGSVHKVRLSAGKSVTLADVVITDQGTIPSTVSLSVAPAATATAAVGRVPPATPTGAKGRESRPAAAPAATRSTPSTNKGAGFDNTFE